MTSPVFPSLEDIYCNNINSLNLNRKQSTKWIKCDDNIITNVVDVTEMESSNLFVYRIENVDYEVETGQFRIFEEKT